MDLSLSGMQDSDGSVRPTDLEPAADMMLPPAEGKPLWGRSYSAQVDDVAVGVDGAIYATGRFSSADFGDGPVNSNGSSDAFLIKFDKNGQRQWARTFGRSYSDVPRKVAVDKAGNSVVVGYSLRTADSGTHDAMVVYFDSLGTQKYFRAYGGPLDSAVDVGITAAFAGDGSVYVAGGFEDRINFGGGDLVSAGSRDIYLLSLSASGAFLFAKRWGFTSYDQASGLAVLPDGDLIMSGGLGYPVDFGDGRVGTDPTVDSFLVRFSAQGVAKWSKQLQISPSSTIVTAAAPDGSLWLAGDTNRAVDFGGGTRPSPTGRGVFSAHYSGEGIHLGSFLIPSTPSSYVNAVAVDSTGQLIVGGCSESDIDFGFGITTKSAGTSYFFKQAANGQVRWAHRFGGIRSTSNDEVKGVALSPNDQVIAGGYLSQNTSLDTVPLTPFGFFLTTTP
jgi:hypothetical protein